MTQGTDKSLLAAKQNLYLVLARNQPVDWHTWGTEAFEKAQNLDRPILLNIGAVWSHWCMVMDSESYNDPQVAQIINDNFIAIRTDRDERPDIDRRYQLAVNSLMGSSGWPLTAFLTPEGKVFFGGTLFPAEQTKSIPSFVSILLKVSDYYNQNKAKVKSESKRIFDVLAEFPGLSPEPVAPGIHSIEEQIGSYQSAFDAANGGFGKEPKFPHMGAIELILSRYFFTKDDKMLNMAETTLTNAAKGGIFDQLGGGFHRYTVDASWNEPHFEKLCAYNAGHLQSYLLAYQITGDSFYKSVAEGTIEFIIDVLSSPEGSGFFAGQASDTDPALEGAYYTWSREEFEAALTPEENEVLSRYFHFHTQNSGKEGPPRSILTIGSEAEEISDLLDMEQAEVLALILKGKKALKAARYKRTAPIIDETLYANWNGYMCSSLLAASMALDKPIYKELALKTIDRFIDQAYSPRLGFAHFIRDGYVSEKRFLDDQAHMANALISAYGATSKPDYLDLAIECADTTIRRFFDEKNGGFFDIEPETANQSIGMLQNGLKQIQDDPIPSGNAMAAHVLDALYQITDDGTYRKYATRTLESLCSLAQSYGIHAGYYFNAVCSHISASLTVIVAGKSDDSRSQNLLKTAQLEHRPNKFVILLEPGQKNSRFLSRKITAALETHCESTKTPFALTLSEDKFSQPITQPARLRKAVKTFNAKLV